MKALATWQDKCIDSQLLVASLVGLFKQRGLNCDKLLRGTGFLMLTSENLAMSLARSNYSGWWIMAYHYGQVAT